MTYILTVTNNNTGKSSDIVRFNNELDARRYLDMYLKENAIKNYSATIYKR